MNREETLKRFKAFCQETIGNHGSKEDEQMANNIIALLEQNSDPAINRKEAVDYVKSFIHEIITESGVDKNFHTNEILRMIARGIDKMNPVVPINFPTPNVIKVQTPAGVIIAEAKGALNEYPGVWIYKNDRDADNMLAAVEYSTPDKKFLIEGYCKDSEEPQVILDYENGKDLA